MQVSTSRVVAFLTPVYAAGGAALTPWLVKYTGLHLNSTEITALSIGGGASATAAALKFLHGNSLWERLVAQLQHDEKLYGPTVSTPAPATVSAPSVATQGQTTISTLTPVLAAVETAIADTREQGWPTPPTTPVAA